MFHRFDSSTAVWLSIFRKPNLTVVVVRSDIRYGTLTVCLLSVIKLHLYYNLIHISLAYLFSIIRIYIRTYDSSAEEEQELVLLYSKRAAIKISWDGTLWCFLSSAMVAVFPQVRELGILKAR